MGGWIGAISRTYEAFYDGIVGQAIFTSLCLFLACLVLYGFRIAKVTRKFAGMVIGAMFGLMVLYLAATAQHTGMDVPGDPAGPRPDLACGRLARQAAIRHAA